jgi:hypothetical protein
MSERINRTVKRWQPYGAIESNLEEIPMSATKLVVTMALLLSATSVTLAQDRQCFGDRPYYDFYGAGWLDSELHLGIDCNIAPPASAHPQRTQPARGD